MNGNYIIENGKNFVRNRTALATRATIVAFVFSMLINRMYCAIGQLVESFAMHVIGENFHLVKGLLLPVLGWCV